MYLFGWEKGKVHVNSVLKCPYFQLFIPKSPYSIEKNSYFPPKMLSQHDQQWPAVLSFSFSISHFFFCQLALTGILKSDAVISGQWYIFFLQNLGHHSSCVKLLRCGLAVRVFTLKTTLPKIWNLRNLFHDWRRRVKYLRLALEEVNVTFITMYCRYKQRKIFFHLTQIEICPRSKTT